MPSPSLPPGTYTLTIKASRGKVNTFDMTNGAVGPQGLLGLPGAPGAPGRSGTSLCRCLYELWWRRWHCRYCYQSYCLRATASRFRVWLSVPCSCECSLTRLKENPAPIVIEGQSSKPMPVPILHEPAKQIEKIAWPVDDSESLQISRVIPELGAELDYLKPFQFSLTDTRPKHLTLTRHD